MRFKNITISCAVLLILLSSCEKVIELDLNEAEKRYVVEANLSDKAGSAVVQITQTKNFDEDNVFPGISGATVTITEVGGNSFVLTESIPGVYIHPSLQAIAGKTYNLSIQVNGENFAATSTVAPAVEIDSLFITDELLFGDVQKTANVKFKDPPGRGHSYRFIQYINGEKEKQLLIINDDYIDGREVTSTLFYFADEDENGIVIKSGDEVRVEFLMIDAPIYLYWFSLLRSATGGNQQATPANPVSNMQGGALGYFSAHSIREATVTVP